jgi:glycosyltransferase involved in cell wall biosynthesis
VEREKIMGYSQTRKNKAAEKKAMREAVKERLKKSINLVGVFIALNEEETIPRLAKSLKGFTNRNVIVDTGSTDKTVEVAKENGFEVLEMKWPNHFAEARNKAVELAQCDDADWIVMFDTDEVLVNGYKLKQEMKLLPPDKDLVAIFHRTGVGHRFHRNCIWKPGAAEWKFRVHEHLLSTTGNDAITLHHDVHHPDAIGTSHNQAKVLEMLAEDAEEFPDNATRQYYYGRQLFYEHRLDAIPFLKHCYEISEWEAEAAHCLNMCGLLYEGKAEKERQGSNDVKEITRCTEKALDFYRASVVKYPRLRASYAGLLRVCKDSKELIRAGMALLSIKESTYFDDSPKFYEKEYEDWVRGVIKFNTENKMKEEAVDVCN